MFLKSFSFWLPPRGCSETRRGCLRCRPKSSASHVRTMNEKLGRQKHINGRRASVGVVVVTCAACCIALLRAIGTEDATNEDPFAFLIAASLPWAAARFGVALIRLDYLIRMVEIPSVSFLPAVEWPAVGTAHALRRAALVSGKDAVSKGVEEYWYAFCFYEH